MAVERAGGRSITPHTMTEDYLQYHFSPGFEAGGFLFVSGQIGLHPSGLAPSDPSEQARIAFERLGAVLAEAQLSYDDIVSITSHHVGDVAGIFDWFPAVKDVFLAPRTPRGQRSGSVGSLSPDSLSRSVR